MEKTGVIIFLIILFTFSFTTMDSKKVNDDYVEKTGVTSINVEMNIEANYIFLQSPLNNSILPSDTPIVFDIDDLSFLEVEFNWDLDPNITWLPPYFTLLPLGDGSHTLHVYVLNNSYVLEYQKFHFITDDTVPIIQLVSVTNNSFYPPETPIDLVITDTNLDRVMYHWEDGPNQSLSYPYSVPLPYEEGSHLLSIYASDAAGNWGSELFKFTVRLSQDTDNDGISDYIEFLLGTDPVVPTTHLTNAPLVIDDLKNDVPNDFHEAIISHNHISSSNWIIGSVSEKGLEDQSDFYIFTSEIRTKGTVFVQCSQPRIQLKIFDLEGQINITIDVIPDSSIGRAAERSTSSDYIRNALPYLVEIPFPLAVELLIVQINGGIAGNSIYSIWIEEIPLQPHLEFLNIFLNISIFLGFPFLFFLTLRWENRRLLKKQQKLEEELESDSVFPTVTTRKKNPPIIVNVRFSEWVFSSIILLILVVLFTELSREKFQNQVSVLTAKGFVDLGYRIFFFAVALIFLGTIFSLGNWVRNRLRRQEDIKNRFSLTRRFVSRFTKITIIFVVYFLLWILFLHTITLLEPSVYVISSLNDILEILKVFFVEDLSVPPSPVQMDLLLKIGVLELIFIVFTLPLAFYMFILNFAGGMSVKKVFRPVDQEKSRWNYKTIILGISLLIEIYRIFSNLLNFIISIFFSENSTFFFIQISEIPWWHQLVTWISQETSISTPALYGLYFELQGIFFAWVIYTSLPSIFRRFMSGSGYSKSITRIGFFLLGMFVIFLRTLHLLLLIPIGVPSFPFSVVLTDPFSILLLIAMISESLEILGFSLGLLLVLIFRKTQLQSQERESPSPIVGPTGEPVPHSAVESSLIYHFEEE